MMISRRFTTLVMVLASLLVFHAFYQPVKVGLHTRQARAATLPLDKGFGAACDPNAVTDSCGPDYICSDSGACVQCLTIDDCDTQTEVCTDGVCTQRPAIGGADQGGNGPGGLCMTDRNCRAGLVCGANKLCQEPGAEPPPDQGGKPPSDTGKGLPGVDVTIEDVFNIINGIACWLIRVVFAVMVIFLVLAGLRFMNARGNQIEFENAKKNFRHVLIGLVVILGTYVIIATVAKAVGADFSFIPLVC